MTHRGRLWGGGMVLLLALSAAAGEGVVEDEKLASGRDLFEQFVLAEHAEAHDQLEALGAIASRGGSDADARGLLPLYRLKRFPLTQRLFLRIRSGGARLPDGFSMMSLPY